MMMTETTLRSLVPAAFAEGHHMTPRYAQIETAKVIGRLADAGYYPVQAAQDRPRSRDLLTVTHRIVLRHEEHIGDRIQVPEVPQIMLVNSHNGRTKLRLYAGFYRFVCANGLVVGNDMFRHEVSHCGDALVEALSFAEEMTDQLGQMRRVIDRWSKIELTAGQAFAFARRAAELRFGTSAQSYDAQRLLEARRTEDEGRTLWRVFNTVQENTVKGGLEGANANGRRVRSRELNAIQPNIAYNSALWNAAEELAEAA
jgi:hypothetical protein